MDLLNAGIALLVMCHTFVHSPLHSQCQHQTQRVHQQHGTHPKRRPKPRPRAPVCVGIDPAPSRRAHDYAQRLHHCDRRIQALDVGHRQVADEERTNDVREADCARHDRQPDDEKVERDTRDEDLASALGECAIVALAKLSSA